MLKAMRECEHPRSPDGGYILASVEGTQRLLCYAVAENDGMQIREEPTVFTHGEAVHDISWFPWMNSSGSTRNRHAQLHIDRPALLIWNGPAMHRSSVRMLLVLLARRSSALVGCAQRPGKCALPAQPLLRLTPQCNPPVLL